MKKIFYEIQGLMWNGANIAPQNVAMLINDTVIQESELLTE